MSMRRTKIPRKGLLTVLLSVVLVLMPAGYVLAKVSGVCSNCHTMHNSQNGTDEVSGGPYGNCLKGSCIGCHSGSDNTGSNSTPYVYSPTTTNMLAGGNFKNVETSTSYGHNIDGLGSITTPDSNMQANIGYKPPGYQTAGTLTWNATNNLKCAGPYGCHGDRSKTTEYAAITGAHHADDSTIDGSTVAKSFRFLYGVKGTEYNTAPNKWAYIPTSSIHNEYKGLTTPDTDVSDISPGSNGSISGLCAECHGNFHSKPDRATATGTASPWQRHPIDIVLNTGGEVTNFNAGTYHAVIPVGRQTPSAVSNTVDITSDTVICLSCHRAHASEYADILRFSYVEGMTAAGGSCKTCHTSKP